MVEQDQSECSNGSTEGLEHFEVKETREKALARLRRLIADGEASGDYQEVDFDELLADLEA
jgi:Arc/MetJ-type ribon-helix-helix transcriptional regulator